MTAPTVEAKNLGRRAADGTWLVREASITINCGDRVGIVGSSGSGKSVLLRAMAGLDAIQEGQLLFKGRPVSGSDVPNYRTRVVYQHQTATLFDGTVESNLKRPFELGVHAKRSFDRDRVIAWLQVLNRDASFLNKDQQNLSGGERQLTSLLRTLQLDPQVLLLDEPTSALDSDSTQAVETLIIQWMSENPLGAFVWISHDARQSDRMCESILHMNRGTLEA